jgi:hypothetical protein
MKTHSLMVHTGRKVLATAAFLATGFAGGSETTLPPEHFAAHATLVSEGSGPYHRLVLPLAIYQSSARPDLGDLRLYNAQGEALPFAMLRVQTRSEAQRREASAPFFPLPATPNGTADLSVSVRRSGDGTLVAVHQGKPTTAAATSACLLIDASRLHNVRGLRLVAGTGGAPFAGYRLETGDDLQHWRILRNDGQFVRLEHAGQHIEQDAIDWPDDADRYLRLTWDDAQQAPSIRSVLLASVETHATPPQLLWTAPLKPARSNGRHYQFDLPGQVPLERLRIDLPQVNSVAPFVLEREVLRYERRRRRQERSWQPVVSSVAYRLNGPHSELQAGDFAGDSQRAGRLRLSLDARGGDLGPQPPTLQIGFVPQELVFLARGDAPYTLAWGAADAESTDLPIATLLPGYRGSDSLPTIDSQLKISSTDLPPALSGKAPPAPSPYRRWILWGVLLAGLGVLALMARALAAQLHHDSTTHS